jgi:hypothetical protein
MGAQVAQGCSGEPKGESIVINAVSGVAALGCQVASTVVALAGLRLLPHASRSNHTT